MLEPATNVILFLIVPWCVFVTASIFGLKEQVALLKAEIAVLNRIDKLLHDIKGC